MISSQISIYSYRSTISVPEICVISHRPNLDNIISSYNKNFSKLLIFKPEVY